MLRSITVPAVLTAMSSLLGCCEEAHLGIASARDARGAWSIVECADFDFDGLADVLWYNPARNVIAVWRMAGTRVLAPGPEIQGPGDARWQAVSIDEEAADFNLDGMADVLWHAPGSNLVAMWLMRGTGVLERGPAIEGPRDEGWNLGTLGDFDGDGMSGILWHNAGESAAMAWSVVGTGVPERGEPFAAPSGPGWVPLIGVDYSGDFLADVLWYNASRNVIAIWLMAGTRVLEKGPEIEGPSGGGWTPVGAPDMNGDDLADMIWVDTARNVMVVWLMAGTRVLEKGPEIAGPSGGGFFVPTLVDFNEDRMADVVWHDPSTNRFAIWLMKGTTVLQAGPTLAGPGG
jgi:hypothetical protein